MALTFDDGPNPPYTEALLKVLADKDVEATFFLIGQQIEAHPATAQATWSGGHEVGGHAYGWKTLAFRRSAHVEAQLDKMDAAFASVGITNLTLFRPPNGLLSPGQNKMLKAAASSTSVPMCWSGIGGKWTPKPSVNECSKKCAPVPS